MLWSGGVGHERRRARPNTGAHDGSLERTTILVRFTGGTVEAFLSFAVFRLVHWNHAGAGPILADIHFSAAVLVVASRPVLDGRVQAISAGLIAAVCCAGVLVVAVDGRARLAETQLAIVVDRASVSIVARVGVVGVDASVAGVRLLASTIVRRTRIVVVAVHLASRDAFAIRAVIRHGARIAVVAVGDWNIHHGDVLALSHVADVGRTRIVVLADLVGARIRQLRVGTGFGSLVGIGARPPRHRRISLVDACIDRDARISRGDGGGCGHLLGHTTEKAEDEDGRKNRIGLPHGGLQICGCSSTPR